MPQPARPVSRRGAVRLLTGASLSLVPALDAREAGAYRSWCRTDPIFEIEGFQEVHLWMAVMAESMREAEQLLRGPIEVVLFRPLGVDVKRADRDDNLGFGQPFRVSIEKDPGLVPRELRFRVRIPYGEDRAAKTWLTRIDAGPISVRGAQARGRTNEWLEFTTEANGR